MTKYSIGTIFFSLQQSSPIAPRRVVKKNAAPPPPVEAKPASATIDRNHRSSIERPVHHPPAVPEKPSIFLPEHRRSASGGGERAASSPPMIPEKPIIPAKPQHDRKPSSGSNAAISPLPEAPKSPRVRPPERPPPPPQEEKCSSLERGLTKPELPPHPTLDRQQRAGSGRPPRPQPPPQLQDRKSSSGNKNDTSPAAISRHDSLPFADSNTDEENTYL